MSSGCQSGRGSKCVPIWYTLLTGSEIRNPGSETNNDEKQHDCERLADLCRKEEYHRVAWKCALFSGSWLFIGGSFALRIGSRNLYWKFSTSSGLGIMTIGTAYNVQQSLQYRQAADKLVAELKDDEDLPDSTFSAY